MFRFVALLLLTVPLAAQTPTGKWSFGIHGGSPEFTGYYLDSEESGSVDSMSFDIKKDLNLGIDKMGLGINAEYSGSRWNFQASYAKYDYSGQNTLTRQITLGGEKFDGNMSITTGLSHAVYDLNTTYKLFRWNNNQAWLGFFLGFQGWSVDINATGTYPPESGKENLDVTESFAVPLPVVGVAFGVNAFNDRLVLGGKLHSFTVSGVKYTYMNADARYYFMPWLGARVFMDNVSLEAPKGSLDDNSEAKLERNIVGFGVVARF